VPADWDPTTVRRRYGRKANEYRRAPGATGPAQTALSRRPSAAVITLSASGTLDAAAISCRVETGRALVEAGLHPATGGSGLQACSGDMLLEALVACAGVTLRAVATALDVPIRAARSGPKATSISEGLWEWPRMPRWVFGTFGSSSSSIPMPTMSSWTTPGPDREVLRGLSDPPPSAGVDPPPSLTAPGRRGMVVGHNSTTSGSPSLAE